MTENTAIIHDNKKSVSTIILNRPEKHNAFDEVMISKLITIFQKIENDPSIRVVILRAEGKNFCAGADLAWMQRMSRYTPEENKQDALNLAKLLETMSHLSKPIITLAQGRVMGGGTGLLACSDIIIAADNARFCFSEVKLGLVPATIAPYVVRSIGFSHARRYFISAELFDAKSAVNCGLIHEIRSEHQLLSASVDFTEQILKNGPNAIAAVKRLMNDVVSISSDITDYTAQLLADTRASQEGKEGVNAFLEKRNPNWNPKD